jgi:hypothetical protein
MGLTIPLTVDTPCRHSIDYMQMYVFVNSDSTVKNFHTLCLIVQYWNIWRISVHDDSRMKALMWWSFIFLYIILLLISVWLCTVMIKGLQFIYLPFLIHQRQHVATIAVFISDRFLIWIRFITDYVMMCCVFSLTHLCMRLKVISGLVVGWTDGLDLHLRGCFWTLWVALTKWYACGY